MNAVEELADVIGRAGLQLCRSRLERGRALALEDVEERLALALADRLPAVDARLVRDHEGLVRLFVAVGYDAARRPDPVRWRSRYVCDLADLDRVLQGLLERRAAA